MSQLFSSGCCSSKSGDHHALDSEEYVKKGNNLLSWKMPKIPTNKLYKTKRFSLFSSDRSIKTREGKASFGNGSAAIRLINESPTMSTFKDSKFYSTFNVGLIQIGVKTLTRKIPENASIILCVRDTRHDKFEDSILGLVESKLGDGPFYFNVFPNITMSVFHSKLFNALVFNVIVEGFEQLPAGSEPISVMFRTVYKLQNDTAPNAMLESPDGKTVFFQTDVECSNETVQKVSNWDEVACRLVFSTVEEKATREEK